MISLIAVAYVTMFTPSYNTDGSVLTNLAGVDLYVCGQETPFAVWIGSDTGAEISFNVSNVAYNRCFEASAYNSNFTYSVRSDSVIVPAKCYSCHSDEEE